MSYGSSTIIIMRSWFSSSNKKGPQILGDDLDDGKAGLTQNTSFDGDGLGGFGTLDTLEKSEDADPRANNNNKQVSSFSSSDEEDDDDDDDQLGDLPGGSSFDEESTVGGGPLFNESDYASVADNATVASYDTRAEGQWRAAKANDFLSDFFENGAKTTEKKEPAAVSKKKSTTKPTKKASVEEEDDHRNNVDDDPFGSSDPFADSDPFASDPDLFAAQEPQTERPADANHYSDDEDDIHDQAENKRRLKKKHSKKESKSKEKDRKHKSKKSKKHKHHHRSKHKSSHDDASDEDEDVSESYSQSTFSQNNGSSSVMMDLQNSTSTNNFDPNGEADNERAALEEAPQETMPAVSDDDEHASTDDDPSISEGLFDDEGVEDMGSLPNDQDLAAVKVSTHSVDVSIDEGGPSEEFDAGAAKVSTHSVDVSIDEGEPSEEFDAGGDDEHDLSDSHPSAQDFSEKSNQSTPANEAPSNHSSSSEMEDKYPEREISESQQDDDPMFQEASESHNDDDDENPLFKEDSDNQSQNQSERSSDDEGSESQPEDVDAKDEPILDEASDSHEDDSPIQNHADDVSLGSDQSDVAERQVGFSFTAKKRQSSFSEDDNAAEELNPPDDAIDGAQNSASTFPNQSAFANDNSMNDSQSVELPKNDESDGSSFDEGEAGLQVAGTSNRHSSMNTFVSGWSKASGDEQSSSADDRSFSDDDDEEDDVSAPLGQDSMGDESTLQTSSSPPKSSEVAGASNRDESSTPEKGNEDKKSPRTSRRRTRTQKHHVDSDISDPDEPLTPGSSFGFISEDRSKQQAAFDDEDVSQEAPAIPTRHASLLAPPNTKLLDSEDEDDIAPPNNDAVPSMPSRRASTGFTARKESSDGNEPKHREEPSEKVVVRAVTAVATPISFVGELDVVDHEPSEKDADENETHAEFDTSALQNQRDNDSTNSEEEDAGTAHSQQSTNSASENMEAPVDDSASSFIDDKAKAEPQQTSPDEPEIDPNTAIPDDDESVHEASENDANDSETEKDDATVENEDDSDSESDIDEDRLAAMMGKLAHVKDGDSASPDENSSQDKKPDAESEEKKDVKPDSKVDEKPKNSWGLSWGFGGSSKQKDSSEDKSSETNHDHSKAESDSTVVKEGVASSKEDATPETQGPGNKSDADKTSDRSLSSWFGGGQKVQGDTKSEIDDAESKASAAESKASSTWFGSASHHSSKKEDETDKSVPDESKAASSTGFFSSVWGGSKKESPTDTTTEGADGEIDKGNEKTAIHESEENISESESPNDTTEEKPTHSSESNIGGDAQLSKSVSENETASGDERTKSQGHVSADREGSVSSKASESDPVDDESVGSKSNIEQDSDGSSSKDPDEDDDSNGFAPDAFLASLNDSKDDEDPKSDGEAAPVAAGAAFLRSLEEQQASPLETESKQDNEGGDDESDDGSSSSSDDSSSDSDSDSDSDNDGVLKVREAPLLRLENVTAQTRNQIPVDHLRKKKQAGWGWGLGAVANAMGVSTHGPTHSTHGIGSTIHGKGPTGISSSDPIPPKSTHAKPAEKAKPMQNKSIAAASVLKPVTEEGDKGDKEKADTTTGTSADSNEGEESIHDNSASGEASPKPEENPKELLHKTSDVMPEALANFLPPEPTADEEAKKTFSFSGASKKATEIREEEEEKPSRKKSKKERKREKKNKDGGGLLGAHFKKNVRKVSRHGDDVSVGTMTMKQKTGDEQQHVAIAASGGFDENSVTKEESRPWEAANRKLKASKMPKTPLGVDNAVPEGEESEGEGMGESNHGGSFKDELESMMEESMMEQSMLESKLEEESQAEDTLMDEATAVTETEGEERDELESLTALESALRRHEEEEKEENFDDVWETASADVSTAIEFERKQRQNFRKKREKLSRKKGKDKSEDEDEKEMKKLRLFDDGKKKGKKKSKKDKGGSDKISTEFLSAIREVFNEDSDAEGSVGSFGLGSAGEEDDDNSDQGSGDGGFGDSDEEESLDDASSKISKKSRKHRKKRKDDSDDSSDDGKSRRSTRSSRSHRSSRSKMSKMSRRSSRTSSSRRSHSSTRKPKLNPAEILDAEMKRQQGAKAMSISSLKQEMFDRRGTSTTMLKKEFEKKKREKEAAAAGWDDAPAISEMPEKKSGFANEPKTANAFDSFGAKTESGSSELHGDLDSPQKPSGHSLSNHLSRWDGDASVNEMDDLRTIQQDGFSVGAGTMGGGFGGGLAAHGGGLAGTLGAPDLMDEPKNSGSGLLGAPAAAMSTFGAGGLDGSSELLSSGPSAEMSLPSFGDRAKKTKEPEKKADDDAMPVFGDFPSMMDTIAEDDGEGERGLLGGGDNWDDGASDAGRSRRSFGVKLKKPKLGFGGLGKKFGKRRGGGSSSKSTGSDWASDEDEFDDGEGLLGG